MKTITISVPKNWTPNAPLSPFKKAASKVWKDALAHFKTDKWDLSYSFLVNEVFLEATGHNLENYLLAHIFKSGKFCLKSKDGALFISSTEKKEKGKKNEKKSKTKRK
jgi:hypothetical protein